MAIKNNKHWKFHAGSVLYVQSHSEVISIKEFMMKRVLCFLFFAYLAFCACSSDENSKSPSALDSEGALEASDKTGECNFITSNVDVEAKCGKEYISEQRKSYEDFGSGLSPFAFTLVDQSYKIDYPYPNWNEYDHTGEDDGGTGKDEVDPYTKAVNEVIEKRKMRIEELSECGRKHCVELGGKDLGIIGTVGAFHCELPSFDAALTIAARDDVAMFEFSGLSVEDP